MEQPITRCCFNHNGQIFAYAVSYDWSKVSNKWQYKFLEIMKIDFKTFNRDMNFIIQ